MIFVHSEDSAPTCLLCVEEDSVTEYSKLSSDQVGCFIVAIMLVMEALCVLVYTNYQISAGC